MTPKSRPGTTENNRAQPQQDNAKGDHDTQGDSVGVNDEALGFSDDTRAPLPPPPVSSPRSSRSPGPVTEPDPAPTGYDQQPGAGCTGRNDRAEHLARVCARFPRTISTAGAQRLARLLRPESDR